MNPAITVQRLLAKDGAVLLRSKNHKVWRLSTGQNFVEAHTASDWRKDHNNMAVLVRLLRKGDEVKPADEQKPTTLFDRISTAIEEEVTLQDGAMQAAQAAETRVALLKELQGFIAKEGALKMLQELMPRLTAEESVPMAAKGRPKVKHAGGGV